MITASVIVPYYGERAALDDCLRALGRQTLARHQWEVIVVNNRPDRKLVLADGCAGLEVTVTEEERPGSYAARNRGAALARGRWLAFTDADCMPDERWLEAGLHHAARHDPLGGHIRLVSRNERPARSLAERYDIAFGLDQKWYVDKSGFAATANLFVSRRVFDAVGPFDARLRSAGDWEWCLRAAKCGHPVTYGPDAIVAHPTRTTWLQIARRALRVQGGMLALHRQLHLELAPGAVRSVIDAFYPRRFAARIFAMKDSGDRSWWQLYVSACLINGLAVAESFRLRLGGVPLR
ncbi:MAG TPA: glycosyltransferase [Ramlibacter sp.]|uniref:glycosyltransferase family 2 protein n=1 Tax=Ramlibacter sp. TaxID=1917967 RepID=UPI002C7C809A|nr:glycosyltransferase [Ramlibacter sp.]HVZ45609.1 glycosyltransferase [Ramlibacter sp.]